MQDEQTSAPALNPDEHSSDFTNIPEDSDLQKIIDSDGVVFIIESMDRYLARKQFISAGKLTDMITLTPREFLFKWLSPDEVTDALMFGSAYHTAVLEAKEFESRYNVLRKKNLPEPDKNFVNSANRKYKNDFIAGCELKGQIMLTEEDHDCIQSMVKVLQANPTTANILKQEGVMELSVYTSITWGDRIYYVKIRPDLVSLIKPFYLDLKKTRNASPNMHEFPADAFRFGYDIKVALYFDVLKEHWVKLQQFCKMRSEKYSELKRALIIAQEDKPPFNVAVYNIPDETMQIGRYRYHQALSRFGECLSKQSWPGYEMYSEEGNRGILQLNLPAYANQEIIL